MYCQIIMFTNFAKMYCAMSVLCGSELGKVGNRDQRKKAIHLVTV